MLVKAARDSNLTSKAIEFQRDTRPLFLKKRFTIGESEEALREIGALKHDEPLKVSPDAEHLSAGGEAALIQVILTWARQQSEAKLQFWAKVTGAPAEHEKLVRRFYGVVASACADQYVDVSGAGVERPPLKTTLLKQIATLQSARPHDAFKGPGWATLCVDHINRSSSYTLHENSGVAAGQLRTKEEFHAVVADIRRATFPNKPALLKSEEITAIADMVYELFRNTEEHARSEISGHRVSRSVRGILAQAHALSPGKLAEFAGGFDPLSAYCAQLPRSPYANAGDKLAQSPLLEISIFDSGPGFAPTIARKPIKEMSSREELSFVRDCFAKNATSKGRPGFGQGLTQVMKVLAEKGGFLRLRTGRLALYADQSRKDATLDGAGIAEWRPTQDDLPEAKGSLLSLFIPIHSA